MLRHTHVEVLDGFANENGHFQVMCQICLVFRLHCAYGGFLKHGYPQSSSLLDGDCLL